MKKMLLRTVPAMMLLAVSGLASAAGFQFWGQNASGLGTAYAGSAAIADNASTVFFNPAGMTQLSGVQVSAGVVGLDSSIRFHDEGSIGFAGGDGGNAGGWQVLPNAYFSWQLTPEFSLGFGVSSPFNQVTEYKDNAWAGSSLALKSDIRSRNYNPSLAYRLNDKVSLGFGVDYQTIDVELTKAGAVRNFKADDSAWGWNAGALFSLSEAMHVGLSYRSAIKYGLSGTADGAAARADLKLPDMFILSVWQQVTDRWEAMGDLSYTRWNSVKSLNVGSAPVADNFNFSNAWRFAWGAAYKQNDDLKLKFGVAFERGANDADDRTARLPEGGQLWLSLGGQWRVGKTGKVDAGYSYLYSKDAVINLSSGGNVLTGRYDNGAHLLGVQYSMGL